MVTSRRFGLLALWLLPTPFLANASGWIFTEMGRQPWVVAPNPQGIPELRLMTADASSPAVSPGMVWTTLIGFALLYGSLLVVELFLLRRYVLAGPEGVMPHPVPSTPGPDDGGDDDGHPAGPPAIETADEEADVLAFAY